MIPRQFRSLVRVALPVAIAVVLVCLALLNLALFHRFASSEVEDGVLWRAQGADLVAVEIAPGKAAERAGVKPGDVLLAIGQRQVTTPAEVAAAFHAASGPLVYQLFRNGQQDVLPVTLQPLPQVSHTLYYLLAAVGIFTVIVGASVRLRRPNDPATLHFFWLTVAFFEIGRAHV